MAFSRTAGFARVELQNQLPTTAALACYRRWGDPADPSAAAPHLTAAHHHTDFGINFSTRRDEYLTVWFEHEGDTLSRADVRPEVPFALPLGSTIVRGKIDLLARNGSGPVVVDFKTDAIGSEGVAGPGEHYRVQRELYALVAAEAGGGGGGPVRAIHLFLEVPEEPVVETMGPLELDAAQARLAELVRRMRDGDYVPTAHPTRQICAGCPAAWNLCPHPAWRPRG
jgi:hypothetical protein